MRHQLPQRVALRRVIMDEMKHSIRGWIGFEIPGDDCEPVRKAMEEAIAELGGTTTGRSLERDDYVSEIDELAAAFIGDESTLRDTMDRLGYSQDQIDVRMAALR